MDLKQIMQEVELEQFQFFKSLIKKRMDKKIYLSSFLGTFMDYFPTNEKDFAKFKFKEEPNFSRFCHQIIDSTCLCQEEIYFFHKMVAIKETNNFIPKCMELYNSIGGLDGCQLGGNIRKCLEESSGIEII